MREDTVTTKVYQFDELSDRAKDKARDWWRDCENQEFGQQIELEFAETAANLLGIEFDTKTVKLMSGRTWQESVIYWSGFGSQGDGASFKGRYSFAADSPDKIHAEFGKDKELWQIAVDLAELQSKNNNSLSAKIDQRGNYVHSGTMHIDWAERVDGEDVTAGAEEELERILRAFADWIYDGLRQEYDYRMSNEAVDDSIRANEYEFTETGKRY